MKFPALFCWLLFSAICCGVDAEHAMRKRHSEVYAVEDGDGQPVKRKLSADKQKKANVIRKAQQVRSMNAASAGTKSRQRKVAEHEDGLSSVEMETYNHFERELMRTGGGSMCCLEKFKRRKTDTGMGAYGAPVYTKEPLAPISWNALPSSGTNADDIAWLKGWSECTKYTDIERKLDRCVDLRSYFPQKDEDTIVAGCKDVGDRISKIVCAAESCRQYFDKKELAGKTCYNQAKALKSVLIRMGFGAYINGGYFMKPKSLQSIRHAWTELFLDGIKFMLDSQNGIYLRILAKK